MERVQRFEGFLRRITRDEKPNQEQWVLACPGEKDRPRQWQLFWDGLPDKPYPSGAHTTYGAFVDQEVVIWGIAQGEVIHHTRIYPKDCPQAGLYHADLALHSAHFTGRLSCELRIDFEMNWVSADFFRNSAWQVSIRGPMRFQNGVYEILRPSLVTYADCGRRDSRQEGALTFQPDSDRGGAQGHRVYVKTHLGIYHENGFEGWVNLETADHQGQPTYYRKCQFDLRWFAKPAMPELSFEDDQDGRRIRDFETLIHTLGIKPTVNVLHSEEQYPLLSDEPLWNNDALIDLYNREIEKQHWDGWKITVLLVPGKPVDDIEGYSGVMFDNASDQNYPRQVCAVFIDQILKKNNLGTNALHTSTFIRELIYWLIHEAGHTFNLSDKMGQTYMNRSLGDRRQFWANFNFDLLKREHQHLRHGFYPEVVPGGFKHLGQRFQPGQSLEQDLFQLIRERLDVDNFVRRVISVTA